jgi:glycosyltransferase involved in cell wall biosynthesis
VAGSLIPLKRTEIAIRVAAALVKEFPQLRLQIAGDGPERNSLEQLASALGVKGNVIFAGQLSRAEVLQAMQKSRVLLHPSEYESFGYVFAEAMECGLPIVSFDVGAAQASAGWKVVSGEDELAGAVREFLLASPIIATTISAEETVRAYAALYSMISGKSLSAAVSGGTSGR